ncbi:hypothetical protein [Heyndrickxia ginsengihumi]|uniref:hypothetical protein n=1 Tax=Heyndrickxia ginsengihumi TaxID=363870 RepID=UPI00046FCF71|nr:hypothetical protein [Heyndrickxia ginsengihumi]
MASLPLELDTSNLKNIRVPEAVHKKLANLSIVKNKKIYETVYLSVIEMENSLTEEEKQLYKQLNHR